MNEIVATDQVEKAYMEDVSHEIDRILMTRSIGFIGRFICRLVYRLLKWENCPLPFIRTGDEGEPVGESIDIRHKTQYDMMEHAARGELTAKVLLDGARINAFECVDYEHVDDEYGITRIQPRWVP